MKKNPGIQCVPAYGIWTLWSSCRKTLLSRTGIHRYGFHAEDIETMEKQLKEMGAMFNWDHEVVTCAPDYYKWTQWLFTGAL